MGVRSPQCWGTSCLWQVLLQVQSFMGSWRISGGDEQGSVVPLFVTSWYSSRPMRDCIRDRPEMVDFTRFYGTSWGDLYPYVITGIRTLDRVGTHWAQNPPDIPSNFIIQTLGKLSFLELPRKILVKYELNPSCFRLRRRKRYTTKTSGETKRNAKQLTTKNDRTLTSGENLFTNNLRLTLNYTS